VLNKQWNDKIFNVAEPGFEELTLEIFRFQYHHNMLYKAYADMLGADPRKIAHPDEIPFLPIHFFKTHAVKTTEFEPQAVFESSGTTQTGNSHHLLKQVELYRQSFIKGFEFFYGPVQDWCIIGLLPSYLERKNSSLVFMVDELIKQSHHPQSGFFLNEFKNLYRVLNELEEKKQKTLLAGVTFALLDFAEKYSLSLHHTTIIETGGMKGRREEMIREELHEILQRKFGVDVIHSEYGMTELLSQAYSKGNGIFHCPPWMKMLIRNEEDPLQVWSQGSIAGSQDRDTNSQHLFPARTGVINIIDLANIYSCSFIATDDAGKLHADGSFEVLGRVDNSDIRGCSLLMV
jgi:hypothetical protein